MQSHFTYFVSGLFWATTASDASGLDGANLSRWPEEGHPPWRR